jgi:cytochrome o ubiquinol oxidase operon protein cyoD
MHINIKSYVVGFILSILFTLIPFIMVMSKMADRSVLIVGISIAAVIQMVIQLKFFLHLDFKPSSQYSLFSFLFTGLMLIVIVFGSIWVMYDLNYFMMDPVMEELGHEH